MPVRPTIDEMLTIRPHRARIIPDMMANAATDKMTPEDAVKWATKEVKGIYDKWVKDSYAALGELRPVRYGKRERSEVAIDAIR